MIKAKFKGAYIKIDRTKLLNKANKTVFWINDFAVYFCIQY